MKAVCEGMRMASFTPLTKKYCKKKHKDRLVSRLEATVPIHPSRVHIVFLQV